MFLSMNLKPVDLFAGLNGSGRRFAIATMDQMSYEARQRVGNYIHWHPTSPHRVPAAWLQVQFRSCIASVLDNWIASFWRQAAG